jgi:integrase
MKGRTTVYHADQTDPEKWASVNPMNRDLYEEFMRYLRTMGKSAETLSAYGNRLKVFFVWNQEHARGVCDPDSLKKKGAGPHFAMIPRREFVDFFGYVRDLGVSPATMASYKSSLSSMSNWFMKMYGEDFPRFNNVINQIIEPIQKSPVREKTVLTDAEVEALLASLAASGRDELACAVALAYASGMRRAELTRMKDSYFTDATCVYGGRFYRTPEKVRTKGRGGGKMLYRYVYRKKFEPYLKAWRDRRAQLGISSEWLFVVRKDGEWEQAKLSTMDSWAQAVTDAVSAVRGEETPFYWHCMRHEWTTALIADGVPKDVVQKLQGWATGDMVDRYNDRDDEAALDDYFGKAGDPAASLGGK